ncbi:MAG: flavin reductase family protein [Eubacteriales bacterium]|nr:flavin reductase family protein [Eubacteriales bacterium]
MSSFDLEKYLPAITEKLFSDGAFLNSAHNGVVNTMTINWGSIGVIWNRPIFTAAVRHSRHSYELIDKSGQFTINIPIDDELKNELAFCGSKSGRDFDKFKECGLTAVKGRNVDVPVIGECGLYLECRIIYKQALEPALLDKSINDKFYNIGDLHTLFYGEIVECYSK